MILLEMKLSVIEGANLTCLKIEGSKVCQKRASFLSLPKNLIRKLKVIIQQAKNYPPLSCSDG